MGATTPEGRCGVSLPPGEMCRDAGDSRGTPFLVQMLRGPITQTQSFDGGLSENSPS